MSNVEAKLAYDPNSEKGQNPTITVELANEEDTTENDAIPLIGEIFNKQRMQSNGVNGVFEKDCGEKTRPHGCGTTVDHRLKSHTLQAELISPFP
ncbi:MAG: hypothetical protein LBC30_03915 [Puniceicoccales bacterium]|jgi:hypothetical protein|nr:hypothetical protein [Puniceicoccales bacterium]